jgi:hypothetical protein
MTSLDISTFISQFLANYNSEEKDKIWKKQSQDFRDFLHKRVMSDSTDTVPDAECDKFIRILDRNGKGNTKESEAVAKAMIAQGAWRRIFNEFHTNKKLGSLVIDILTEENPDKKAGLIDLLYKINEGKRNNLTGPAGNMIGAFLAAYDPFNNLSMISLNDRRALIEFLNLPVPFDWDKTSIGTRIVATNKIILDGMRKLGLNGSARTVSVFCYFPPMKALWKGEHTVSRVDKEVDVTVPVSNDNDTPIEADSNSIRESMQVQALIAKIGASMGFSIWLPKADRGRVTKAWVPENGELLESLPLGYDPTTMKTIEQIDVLWLRKRSIVRAFEVEHTTSVYSGLLRMADLVALQPNININLHIVAPEAKRDKVMQEIHRPVFSLLEGRALSEMCTFLSYDSVKDIGDNKHLSHLSDNVIEDYEEKYGD